MTSTNIERFDQLTGRVFADLYAAFPIPKTLSDISYANASSTEADESEQEVNPEFANLFVYTVRWLAASEYLTHSVQMMSSPYVFEDCVLTAKGLEALKATPASIGGKSLGQSLQDAAKTGAMDALKKLSGQVLSVGMHMVTKAAMSHLHGS